MWGGAGVYSPGGEVFLNLQNKEEQSVAGCDSRRERLVKGALVWEFQPGFPGRGERGCLKSARKVQIARCLELQNGRSVTVERRRLAGVSLVKAPKQMQQRHRRDNFYHCNHVRHGCTAAATITTTTSSSSSSITVQDVHAVEVVVAHAHYDDAACAAVSAGTALRTAGQTVCRARHRIAPQTAHLSGSIDASTIALVVRSMSVISPVRRDGICYITRRRPTACAATHRQSR